MTAFEQFAKDHAKHIHCIACGGCILAEINMSPVWCMTCYKRIDKALPPGAAKPWGYVFGA